MSELLHTPLNLLSRVAVSLGPVLTFLVILYLMDAHRLVKSAQILKALLAGAMAAGISYLVNNQLLAWSGMPLVGFAFLVAPVVEECVKALYCGWLVKTHRVGFLVDGTILGFATGAGFALVENVFYLDQLQRTDLLVWAVRGFGTALMHGGATALFVIVMMGTSHRGNNRRFWGLALAVPILLHTMFNRLMIQPVLATVGIAVLVPMLMVLVYRWGETEWRYWLGEGMDRDLELLAMIDAGEVDSSPLGCYLQDLKIHLQAPAVVDMLCLLRLQAQLNIAVKGGMLLRENDLPVTLPGDLRERLTEVDHLQKSLGHTGLLAMRPVSRWRGRRPWQWHRLQQWLAESAL